MKGHTQGFTIEWHDDKFDTNKGGRCKAGIESVSAYIKLGPSIVVTEKLMTVL